MNELRAVRWECISGYTDGYATFIRSDDKKRYWLARHSPHQFSKTRFLCVVRKYVKRGYNLVPNFRGWTLVVKE